MSIGQDAEPSALQQLGSRYGISIRFDNAFGRSVAVDPETIEKLLESMGVSIASDADAANALERFERKAAERALPASIVIIPQDGRCFVNVSGSELPSPLDWLVTLEDGGERRGSFDWAGEHRPATGGVVLPLADLPLGYHRLRLPQLDVEAHLIVSPGDCWLPEDTGHGHWGIAVQLYLVKSSTNWGIGDFSDLRAIVEMSAARGCGFIGLNPLHQMFLDNPEAASPYSPATRLFLNPLYIDVRAIPEWRGAQAAQALVEAPAFQQRLAAARSSDLVNYAAVAALKIEALQIVFESFRLGADPSRREAFAAFQTQKGRDLQRASLFQVLRLHLGKDDPQQADWRNWSKELQTAGSDALARFAEEHADELTFQDWLQFIADEQFEQAAQAARDAGMAVGLYRDLAVGSDASGAETWANPVAFLQRTLVGAPPDIFNPAGQNWGLPPLDPVALAEEGFRSFAELIRANMLHAGGLRIDHVMGLRRLFCIPEGLGAAHGAYVNFPLDDLIGVLALESQRQQCLVVGEDLGTVPPGFRERLAAANILSYRVLFFEQNFDTSVFAPPNVYPHGAFANTGSHDLPTLLAWWQGEDLALKQSLGLYDSPEETASQEARRERERQNILHAFADAGLFQTPPQPSELSPERFAQYAHQFLALTPSMLLATQLDDMTGDTAPVNIPGTWMEHPNWRRKYRLSLEELAGDETAWNLVAPFART